MPEPPRDERPPDEHSHDKHSTDGASRAAATRRIRNRALTIGVSVTPFGLSFGAVSVEAHLSLIQVCLLSLVLFSGASQFALVSVIGAGGSYFSAVGTALLLGVRNGLYGARINALLRPGGWRRLVTAEVTIDESTAMAVSEAPAGHAAQAFWLTALSVYVLWNVSTIIGALVGNALGSPATTGLDVAGPAAFIALLAPRLTTLRLRLLSLGSGVIALVAVPFVPVGAPILIGGLTAVALLLVFDR
jgi:predicted branched-subunit amino acid permease